jgi:hypothetical protein
MILVPISKLALLLSISLLLLPILFFGIHFSTTPPTNKSIHIVEVFSTNGPIAKQIVDFYDIKLI